VRTTIAIRMIAAKIRINNDPAIGRRGFCLFGGTGGSSIPTAAVFRGGPPAREEDACGSGSGSHSVNSKGIFGNATTSPRCKAIVLWEPEGDCEGPGQFVAPNRLRVAGLNRRFIHQSHEEITGTLADRAFFIAVISGCLAVCTFAPIRCLDGTSVNATAALLAAGFGTTAVCDPHVVTGAATLCTTGNREFSFHLLMIRLCWCVDLKQTAEP